MLPISDLKDHAAVGVVIINFIMINGGGLGSTNPLIHSFSSCINHSLLKLPSGKSNPKVNVMLLDTLLDHPGYFAQIVL